MLAAVILLFGMAMAVSADFREAVFSVFRIQTVETPPHSQIPAQPGIRQISTLEIEGRVTARYFTNTEFTYGYPGGVYSDGSFFALTEEGLERCETKTVDFLFPSGDKALRIHFDYAVLQGKLCLHLMQENLNLDPYGYGWNAAPIGGRTDVVLLHVPVLCGDGYSTDYLLLDLQAQKPVPFVSHGERALAGCRVTDDLRYALLAEFVDGALLYKVMDLDSGAEWVFDRKEDPCFLDNHTLLFTKYRADRVFDLIRMDLTTGEQTVVADNLGNCRFIYPWRGGEARKYWLNEAEDGGLTLINAATGEKLELAGLRSEGLETSLSPDGRHILFAGKEWIDKDLQTKQYTSVGILDPESGVLRLLKRDPQGAPEAFRGWSGSETLLFSSPQGSDGFCLYFYEFT